MKLDIAKSYQIHWQNREQLEVIVAFLYKRGFHRDSKTAEEIVEEWYHEKYHYLIFYPSYFGFGGNYEYKSSTHQLLTMDELFTSEFETAITIQLNDEYKAVVTSQHIKVGCQTFTHAIIKQLYEASVAATKI